MATSRLSGVRVVIAEPFSETGIGVLRDAGIDVISVVGQPQDALYSALAYADGLIVREMVEDIDFAALQAKTEAALRPASDLRPLRAPVV